MNRVGEYTCSGATGTSITLSFLQGSWSSSNAGAGVTVKITAFDPVTHHYSGTFSGSVASTDGIINDFQYQTP